MGRQVVHLWCPHCGRVVTAIMKGWRPKRIRCRGCGRVSDFPAHGFVIGYDTETNPYTGGRS